jgi:hypothetical protein
MRNYEFEEYVASKLVEFGYPIFHRNLKVFYNKNEITEFDIVSMNFILEVKSSKFTNCKNKGFIQFYSNNLLPENFKYFIYSAQSTYDEITTLKNIYSNPDYIFINNLEKIKEYITPQKNIECLTKELVESLLHLHYTELNKITHIYIPYTIYMNVYDTLVKLRDIHTNNYADVPHKLEVLEYLQKTNKLVFDKENIQNIYPFKRRRFISKKLVLTSLKRVTIDLFYYIDTFQKDERYSKKSSC